MASDAFWAAAFSSATDKWDTPPELVAQMAPLFPWDVDVCASSPNVCETYFGEQPDGAFVDGLEEAWTGLCWMNPPYGRQIGKWVDKARRAARAAGTAVVCLLPARTDTAWWQRNVIAASMVVHIAGRLCYGSEDYWSWRWSTPFIPDGKGGYKKNALYEQYGKRQSAPFPSAFMVFGHLKPTQYDFLATKGVCARYAAAASQFYKNGNTNDL